MDIYVGNLPYSATEEDVSGLFAAYGPVERVKIITDRETGRSKGFAFVTLGDQYTPDSEQRIKMAHRGGGGEENFHSVMPLRLVA